MKTKIKEKVLEKVLKYHKSRELAEKFYKINNHRFDTEDNPEEWEFEDFRLKKTIYKALSEYEKEILKEIDEFEMYLRGGVYVKTSFLKKRLKQLKKQIKGDGE